MESQQLEVTKEPRVVAEAVSFSAEQVALLKNTVAKGTTNDELALFMHVCRKSGLDPFSKQIYAIKRKNRRTGQEEMTIQTGIDGYRVIAERTGQYAPGKEPTYSYDANNRVRSATAYLNKLVQGKWFEVSATAFFEEYAQEANYIWQKMPHVMLAKCAEALALRRAFPNEMSGLYTAEEMGQADNESKVPMPRTKEIPAPAPERPFGTVGLYEGVPPEEPDEELIEDDPPAIEFPSAPPVVPAAKKTPPEDKISRESQKMLFALARDKKIDEEKVKRTLWVMWGIESTKDLTNAQLDTLVALIKKGAIK